MDRSSLRRAAEDGSWRLFQLRQFLDATHGSVRVAASLLTASRIAQEVSVHPVNESALSMSKVSFYGFIGYRAVRFLRDKYDAERIPDEQTDLSRAPTAATSNLLWSATAVQLKNHE